MPTFIPRGTRNLNDFLGMGRETKAYRSHEDRGLVYAERHVPLSPITAKITNTLQAILHQLYPQNFPEFLSMRATEKNRNAKFKPGSVRRYVEKVGEADQDKFFEIIGHLNMNGLPVSIDLGYGFVDENGQMSGNKNNYGKDEKGNDVYLDVPVLTSAYKWDLDKLEDYLLQNHPSQIVKVVLRKAARVKRLEQLNDIIYKGRDPLDFDLKSGEAKLVLAEKEFAEINYPEMFSENQEATV